jgi:hypothetical protein
MGNLLTHLELRALLDGGELDGMAAAMLRGNARSGVFLDPDLLDPCRRLSLLRLVGVHREPRLPAVAASPRPCAPACSATS